MITISGYPQVGVALVGYGSIGKVHTFAYRTLPFFYAELPLLPHLEYAVVHRTETIPLVQNEGGFSYVTTDLQEAVTNPRVGMVDCCTPNSLHASVVLAALQAGKHVYCEKPLALNLNEARSIVAAAEQAGVTHQVAFNYRFVPAVLRAKQLIDEGRIGSIYGFRFLYLHSGYTDKQRPISWRMQKAVSGSGALGDLGSHIIDLSRFLLGEYQAVLATLHTYIRERPVAGKPAHMATVDVDDMFLCQVRLATGALGTIEASRMATGTNDDLRFEIHGDRGALRFHLMEPNWLEFYDATAPADPFAGERGFTRIETAQRYPTPAVFPSPRAPVGWLRFHVASQYDFLCRIVGKPAVGATFIDGLRAQEIMTAMELSQQRQTWVHLAEVASSENGLT